MYKLLFACTEEDLRIVANCQRIILYEYAIGTGIKGDYGGNECWMKDRCS